MQNVHKRPENQLHECTHAQNQNTLLEMCVPNANVKCTQQRPKPITENCRANYMKMTPGAATTQMHTFPSICKQLPTNRMYILYTPFVSKSPELPTNHYGHNILPTNGAYKYVHPDCEHVASMINNCEQFQGITNK